MGAAWAARVLLPISSPSGKPSGALVGDCVLLAVAKGTFAFPGSRTAAYPGARASMSRRARRVKEWGSAVGMGYSGPTGTAKTPHPHQTSGRRTGSPKIQRI